MERCENCASVEAERDMAEARLKTAMYDTQVHKLNSARATTAREDALILRDAAEQALADLREKMHSYCDTCGKRDDPCTLDEDPPRFAWEPS